MHVSLHAQNAPYGKLAKDLLRLKKDGRETECNCKPVHASLPKVMHAVQTGTAMKVM